MKKKISVFFILIATVLCLGNIIPKYTAKAEQETAKASVLIEANTGKILQSTNEKQRLPIASMCKIMTLLLSFESIDKGELSLDDEITVSENASNMGGSQVFLESGANYKVSELIKSITIASANDSCVAMAEKISGSEEQFVAKMNEKARELNMNDTVFTNCTGLPKAGQYSCAVDVATMFNSLIKHKDYFKFSNIWMDEIKHPKERVTQISNTNKLIKFYEGCDGGKTGYTAEAGHCLCATALKNGLRLISVVISAPNSKARFSQVSQMFNHGFNKYVSKMIINSENCLDEKISVKGGKKDEIIVKPEKPIYLLCDKNEKIGVETKLIKNDNISAPVNVGDFVGKLEVYKDGVLIETVNVISAENVEKKTFKDYLDGILDNWGII